MKKTHIYFIWHWFKRLKGGPDGERIAVEDTLIDAIYALAKEYHVTIIALSPNAPSHHFDSEKEITYLFCRNQDEIIAHVHAYPPKFLFFSHHSKPYDLLIDALLKTGARALIYYSAPISLPPFDLLRFKYRYGVMARPLSPFHKDIQYHIVQHAYQKEELLKELSIDADRVYVAPKSANPNLFFPIVNEKKKWDVIYPGRSTEGYFKRPELAIDATRMLGMSLFMPGAKLRKHYAHVMVPDEWMDGRDLNRAYNQCRILLITTNYRDVGPRVIPEAFACNLPVVCCADSPACVSHVKRIGGYIAKPNAHDIAKKLLLASRTVCRTREEIIRLGEPDAILRIIKRIIEQQCKDVNL